MTDLVDAIGRLAGAASAQAIDRIASAALTAGGPGHGFKTRASRDVRARDVQQHLAHVADAWEGHPLPVDEFNRLLTAATAAAEAVRTDQRVRLVWTGPPTGEIALATADTLLDVINSATETLLLSTYNGQDEPSLVDALTQRIAAGVDVRLIGETVQDHPGDYSKDAATNLAAIKGLRSYRWPKEKRQDWIAQIKKDHHAHLHAKIALADSRRLLIGSVNLTGPAMHSNMEMSVLIEGGALPRRVHEHYQLLMQRGILRTIL